MTSRSCRTGHSCRQTCTSAPRSPPTLCPYVEYLIKWNDIRQLHLKHKVRPVNGRIGPTNAPGLGLEIDESTITDRRELSWR